MTDHGPGYEVLGQTLDDAAGEAFDKGARLLGLGYPGGAALERLARDGDPEAFDFPTGARMPGLDFSFAGLKTALLYRVRELGEAESERRRADLAASYQRAIVEALALRVERALEQTGAEQLAVGGGVAANGPLRDRLSALGVPRRHPAARAVHRQRRDDRQRRALRAGAAVPGVPGRRRLRHRGTGARLRDRGGALRPRRLLPVRRRPRDPRARPGRHPFALTERDIDADEALLRAYLERIPVVDHRGRWRCSSCSSTRRRWSGA